MRTTRFLRLLPLLLVPVLPSCQGGGEDSPGAPVATTLAATSVGEGGATLNGTVNPNGLETTAWFEWGTDPGLATFESTPRRALGSGTGPRAVAEAISGLAPATTYYCRVTASSAAGAAAGSIVGFSTTSPPSFAVAATSPADGATGVALGTSVRVTFSREVEPATLVNAIHLRTTAGELPGTIAYDATTWTAIFTPAASLAPLTDHTVTVDDKVKSVTTVRLPAPFVFAFTTGAGP